MLVVIYRSGVTITHVDRSAGTDATPIPSIQRRATMCTQFSSPFLGLVAPGELVIPCPFLFPRRIYLRLRDMRLMIGRSRVMYREGVPAARTTTIINNSTGIINDCARIYPELFFFASNLEREMRTLYSRAIYIYACTQSGGLAINCGQ